MTAAEYAVESRVAQDLPVTVVDPAVLAEVAALLIAGDSV